MLKRSNILPLIPLLVLVLILVLSGILVLRSKTKKNQPIPGLVRNDRQVPIGSVSGKVKSNNLPNLSASPTAEESKNFSRFVDQNAKQSQELNLTNCDPNPKVIRVKKGIPFSLVNSDSVEHWIILSGQNYIAPAKGSLKVTLNELAGYRYTCFTSNSTAIEAVGYLEVVN